MPRKCVQINPKIRKIFSFFGPCYLAQDVNNGVIEFGSNEFAFVDHVPGADPASTCASDGRSSGLTGLDIRTGEELQYLIDIAMFAVHSGNAERDKGYLLGKL